MKANKQTVYVAMSGGVDSSVSAALLKKQGFNVVGVFMKQWQPDLGDRICIWKQEREDAMKVAAKLEIPLLTWDFSKEYKKKVAQYMIDAYKKGITPNPDVMCNRDIKFGLFFDKAVKEGADLIATGHYAQVKKSKDSFKLLKGKDKNKDQSYFLWTLNQTHLSKTLFPVGEYTKPEVRKLAKKFGLPTFDKKDSQGVCFIGPLNMEDFLKQYIKPKTGNIIFEKRVIGQHEGAAYYTIGQRHGLKIGSGGGPYYVTGKDIKKNIVFVGKEVDLESKKAQIADMTWANGGIKFPSDLDIKIRYRTPSARASLRKDGTVLFKNNQRAITPGQSAVFYKGQELLGGGFIL